MDVIEGLNGGAAKIARQASTESSFADDKVSRVVASNRWCSLEEALL